MCGIAGYYLKKEQRGASAQLKEAIGALRKRGPDLQQCVTLSPKVALAHARLSIIDTSAIANQPMTTEDGRFTVVFNGEIFNYKALQERFLAGVKLRSHSDTEVLLELYARLGKDCLQHLNGFFAFAIFDSQTKEVLLARDRYGIKPLHIYSDGEKILFGSEIKALLKFNVKKELDYETLALYLQLNYIPGTHSMLKGFKKLQPGYYAVIDGTPDISFYKYYSIPYKPGSKIDADQTDPYDVAKNKLRGLIQESVQRRLVSDVPLGTFLSGGIDSSIVTACASMHTPGLNTFSIGYKDEPYFDETKYANLVAEKFKTNHTVFSISNDEMFDNIFNLLDYIDEPFADSSAIAVYILCQKTKQKVTVSLSGDGGDELFAGYNKHNAEIKARTNNLVNLCMKAGLPIFKLLPKSRHSKWGNLFRQLQRYSEGLQLSPGERYWRWCTFQPQQQALALLRSTNTQGKDELADRVKAIRELVTDNGDLNDVLYADTQMVLPNDMLTKVDLMSMANSLEVRVPLLDYTVVDYAFTLPVTYKNDGKTGKKILKDAFRDILPAELFTRAKHGFEVPLLKWLKTGLQDLINNELLAKDFIIEQGIFDYNEIAALKQKLQGSNPGDVHAVLWGLLVFQYWYKKYFL